MDVILRTSYEEWQKIEKIIDQYEKQLQRMRDYHRKGESPKYKKEYEEMPKLHKICSFDIDEFDVEVVKKPKEVTQIKKQDKPKLSIDDECDTELFNPI